MADTGNRGTQRKGSVLAGKVDSQRKYEEGGEVRGFVDGSPA